MTSTRAGIPRWLPPLLLAATAVAYAWTLGRPSFWLDEAWEANYYAGYEAAPWYNRPMLYMAGVRALVRLFGPSELVMRLLPCAAGIAAIALTYRLARRWASRGEAILACGILALAEPFVSEAHQLKYYAFDAMFTAGLVLLFERWRARPGMGRLAAYALVALLSFGFAFGSIFVVAGIGIAPVLLRSLPPRAGRAHLAAHAALAAVFAAVFVAFHAGGARDPMLVGYFVDSYAPWRTPLALPLWLASASDHLVVFQAGASSGPAVVLLVTCGAWLLWRSPSRTVVGVTGAALLLNLVASAIAVYPFGVPRLSIYAAPLIAVLAARAIGAAAVAGPARVPRLAAAAALVLALFGPGAAASARRLATGFGREEIRDLVGRIAAQRKPGETLFVNEDALTAFQFYWCRAGKSYPPEGLVVAGRLKEDPQRHLPEVEALAAAGAPVWSLLTHLPREESETVVAMLGARFEHDRETVVGDARLDRWTAR